MNATKESKIDLALRIYRIVRGLPHHRIALASVIGGIIVLSGPFWEPYLRAILSEWLDIAVDPPTNPVFGALLVVAGMLYHIAVSYLELTQKRFDHDISMDHAKRNRDHDRDTYAPFLERFSDDRVVEFLYLLTRTTFLDDPK
ncbi:MAG: hypothetical protein R3D99_02930 [Altererythrobacter sp.]